MDFWQTNGWLFLLGCMCLPRITTAFFASVTFGFWAIVGWIFTPHILVAIWATTYYWNTNRVLVIISWFVALIGTIGEAEVARKASS